MGKKLEEIIRENFDEIHELSETDNTNPYSDDYLRLFNHCTTEEELEVISILEDIKKKFDRLYDIQDNCYSA